MKSILTLTAGTAVACAAVACGGSSVSSPSNPQTTSSPQPTTFLTIVSNPGDYVGQGRTYRFTNQTGSFVATQLCNALHVRIRYLDNNSGYLWSLDFGAPVGARLTPGTYEGTARWPFQAPTQAGLSVTGEGRGCNREAGRFAITEASYGANGAIERFSASFEDHCEVLGPGLTGEISLVSPPTYDLLWLCS
jgi:hypothetical protein